MSQRNNTIVLLQPSTVDNILRCTNEVTDQLKHFRAVFHFIAENMWMNDPNGMFFNDGVYHLYYQFHPHNIDHGSMHWGHATIKDLLHWDHEPVALIPDSLGSIFLEVVFIRKATLSVSAMAKL